MVVVLVVPCPLALRVWWSWHGVDVCGRWWLTGLQGLGAAVRWWWWALVGAVLLVCPGGLGVGWCSVAGPGPWSGCRAPLAGALAGLLTCLGLLGLVAVGGGLALLSPWGLRGAGVPAVRLSEARLAASDVGGWSVRPIRVAVALSEGQAGIPKGRPALRGPQLRGVGVVCWVEECAEWVGCSFPSAEGGVEPAASDSEVGCYLLWCRVRPRFWRQGCCLGGR